MDPTIAALAERVANLERVVAEMRAQTPPPTPVNWIKQLKMSGVDAETFEEAMRLGREFR